MCPICGVSYGKLQGNQPDGTMTYASVSTDLPGHPGCGTIIINLKFPDGVQTVNKQFKHSLNHKFKNKKSWFGFGKTATEVDYNSGILKNHK